MALTLVITTQLIYSHQLFISRIKLNLDKRVVSVAALVIWNELTMAMMSWNCTT